MRRPSCPQDDDRDDVNKHHNNGNNGEDNGNHCGAVETNAGEIDGDDCYLAPLKNITIQYVVAAMV